MVLADVHLSDIIWSMLWLFFLFIWIMILVQVLIDLFRDHEMSGVAKALWVIALVFVPFITVFVYIIARGSHMAERSMKQQQAAPAADGLVRQERVRPARRGRADREGEGAPRRWHDHTGRVRSAEGEGTRLARRGATWSPGSSKESQGGRSSESTPWWPPLPSAPDGAPNVVVVLLDDVGYAQFGCYGSTIATPTFDRLAAQRPALLELPHDGAVLADARLPADGPQPPSQRHGSHRRVRVGLPGLRRDHAEGERDDLRDPRAQRVRDLRGRQVASRTRRHDGRRRPARPVAARSRVRAVLRVPRRRDRPVPPRSRRTTTTRSIRRARPRRGITSPRTWSTWRACYLTDLRAASPTKPFFLWFAPGACHAPHQAPKRVHRQVQGRVRPRLGRVPRRGVREADGDAGCCPRAPS